MHHPSPTLEPRGSDDVLSRVSSEEPPPLAEQLRDWLPVEPMPGRVADRSGCLVPEEREKREGSAAHDCSGGNTDAHAWPAVGHDYSKTAATRAATSVSTKRGYSTAIAAASDVGNPPLADPLEREFHTPLLVQRPF